VSWEVERRESALHITLSAPLGGEWESLMDAIQESLSPKPLAIHLPSRIEGASPIDAIMLQRLWNTLGWLGIPILPPTSGADDSGS
jgi:hypothetical protein